MVKQTKNTQRKISPEKNPSESLDLHSATVHLIQDLRSAVHVRQPGCGEDPSHRQLWIQATVLQGFLIDLGLADVSWLESSLRLL